jgi:hypothetical protein
MGEVEMEIKLGAERREMVDGADAVEVKKRGKMEEE